MNGWNWLFAGAHCRLQAQRPNLLGAATIHRGWTRVTPSGPAGPGPGRLQLRGLLRSAVRIGQPVNQRRRRAERHTRRPDPARANVELRCRQAVVAPHPSLPTAPCGASRDHTDGDWSVCGGRLHAAFVHERGPQSGAGVSFAGGLEDPRSWGATKPRQARQPYPVSEKPAEWRRIRDICSYE